jgi:hypothetical protein
MERWKGSNEAQKIFLHSGSLNFDNSLPEPLRFGSLDSETPISKSRRRKNCLGTALGSTVYSRRSKVTLLSTLYSSFRGKSWQLQLQSGGTIFISYSYDTCGHGQLFWFGGLPPKSLAQPRRRRVPRGSGLPGVVDGVTWEGLTGNYSMP